MCARRDSTLHRGFDHFLQLSLLLPEAARLLHDALLV